MNSIGIIAGIIVLVVFLLQRAKSRWQDLELQMGGRTTMWGNFEFEYSGRAFTLSLLGLSTSVDKGPSLVMGPRSMVKDTLGAATGMTRAEIERDGNFYLMGSDTPGLIQRLSRESNLENALVTLFSSNTSGFHVPNSGLALLGAYSPKDGAAQLSETARMICLLLDLRDQTAPHQPI